MIRVLQLITTTGPGGAETVFLSLLSGFPKAEWEMIPVLTGPGWLRSGVEERGFSVIEEKTEGSFDFRFLGALRRLIKEHSVDLVHAHLQGATVYAALATAGKRVPLVATFHGYPDLEFPGVNGWAKKKILRGSNCRFVFVSEALRQDAVAWGIVPENRTFTITNGVDLTPFSFDDSRRPLPREDDPGGPYVVGSIGNIRPAKDYPNLIKAAGVLHKDFPGAFKFLIVGQRKDPLYSELTALREGLGLDDSQVSFLGFQEDIPGVLAGLDCLVIPSSSEGFSLVAVQAMAAGVPVVSTRCGGPEGIIEDMVSGHLVPAEDPGALAHGISKICASSELRERFREKGRAVAEDRYSAQAMIAAYADIYRSALEAPSPF